MRGLVRAQRALPSWGRGSLAILPRRTAAPSWLAATTNRPAAQTPSPPPPPPDHPRAFSQSVPLRAKRDKKANKGAQAVEADEGDRSAPASASASSSSGFDHEAAFDLADVDADYARIDERFEKRVQEWKVGRFNPDVLGQLRVQPDRAAPDITYPLAELAQVVHHGGRHVGIIVSDASYIKPVMSAVQASRAFNQQPQPSPHNDLELVLRIEADNPEEQTKKLKAECNAWRDAVRDVMAARRTKHAKWAKAKDITKDDVRRLDKTVKALQDKKLEAIEKREKQLQTEQANRSKRL